MTAISTVMIVGAGYAGVTAANRVRASFTDDESGRIRVVMVNRSKAFTERIRLHELAAGSRAGATIPLPQLLHEAIEVIVGEVSWIDARDSTVTIQTAAGPRVESYTTLIYAVGSVGAAGVPGAGQFAHLLADPDGAVAARDAIAGLSAGGRVIVVGGGPTGVEAAAEIAEHRPGLTVTLLCGGGLLGHLPDAGRARI